MLVKILNKIKLTVGLLLLPFMMYTIYEKMEKLSIFEFYYFLACFYFVLLNSLMILITKFVEETHNVSNKKSKYFLILAALKFIFITSLLFSTYYWVINDYDNNNFINVTTGDKVDVFIDFFFYSTSNFVMNNASDIKPNSILAKGIVLTQIITSFTTIVLFLSNHKELGNFFKQMEDDINKKKQ